MQHIEMLSAGLGLLGAFLLATKSRYAGLAFVAWFVSNLGWLIFGAHNDHWFFFVQQIGFTVTSVLGIWNWLVNPALRQAQAEDEGARERRAFEAITLNLDQSFVGTAHTKVLVTYMTLERIYAAGEEEGRALERERAGGVSP
ncbi:MULTISPECIES: hypothetical protein [Acidovorax]|uniref:Nicotinamide riboside transporter PnuC n=1 Tax=Acidovorax facilis TaxID=12917 RepID=A0ABV8DD32_9BURK|nr:MULTISPECIES: hypothetical protein [Acidovorax]MBO1007484.1 hypothetical protein [Acidovorax sp. SD340]MCO4241333.1 hypothetical protein [Acidovorax facilis]